MGKNGNQKFILVAIDGSRLSQMAATLACQIAAYQQLEIKGLYVVNAHYVLNRYTNVRPEIGPVDPPASRSELVDLLKLKGEMAMDWLGTLCHSMRIPFEYEIVFGQVADIVARQSAQAKLVAFGKKGFHQPDDWSHLGENFQQFRHQVKIPFIAGDKELRPVHSILMGYGGSQPADLAWQWAQMVAEVLQAKLFIATVVENDHDVQKAQELQPSMQGMFRQNYERVLLKGTLEEQLANAAIRFDIDLLVISRCHRNALSDWFRGSTLDRLLRSTRVTTLVV